MLTGRVDAHPARKSRPPASSGEDRPRGIKSRFAAFDCFFIKDVRLTYESKESEAKRRRLGREIWLFHKSPQLVDHFAIGVESSTRNRERD